MAFRLPAPILPEAPCVPATLISLQVEELELLGEGAVRTVDPGQHADFDLEAEVAAELSGCQVSSLTVNNKAYVKGSGASQAFSFNTWSSVGIQISSRFATQFINLGLPVNCFSNCQFHWARNYMLVITGLQMVPKVTQ